MDAKRKWRCGGVGLVADAGILLFAVLLSRTIAPLVADVPLIVGLVFILFLSFSLAEIPLMVIVLRNLAARPDERNPAILCGGTALYVAFAGVYAGLSVTLTGWVIGALIIALIGVIRFGSLAVI
jgi:hypothetical protein